MEPREGELGRERERERGPICIRIHPVECGSAVPLQGVPAGNRVWKSDIGKYNYYIIRINIII